MTSSFTNIIWPPCRTAPPTPTSPANFPADAYAQLIRTLRLALPPPLSESPEDLARRDHAAIARIAALTPANAAEADLAALYVAASEQWKESLRLVQQPDISNGWAMKCRAQANSMMRQAQSALRLLPRMQAAREKREANSAARERAAWTEHCAIGLMARALTLPALPETAAMTAPPMPEPNAAGECASAGPQPAALLRGLQGKDIAIGEGHRHCEALLGRSNPGAPASNVVPSPWTASPRNAARNDGFFTDLGTDLQMRSPCPASAGGEGEKDGLAAIGDRALWQSLPDTIVCVPPDHEPVPGALASARVIA